MDGVVGFLSGEAGAAEGGRGWMRSQEDAQTSTCIGDKEKGTHVNTRGRKGGDLTFAGKIVRKCREADGTNVSAVNPARRGEAGSHLASHYGPALQESARYSFVSPVLRLSA